jgi:hypothetical protein
MKILKTFENFNSSSSADEYIKSVLSKFGLEYEEDVHDDAGNLCIKAEFIDDKTGIFYIFASHPDKEHATYHIQFLVNDRIEDEFSTPNLEDSIRSMIEELR